MVNPAVVKLLSDALIQTAYMTAVSVAISCALGLPLGIAITVTEPGHIMENRFINRAMSIVVDAARSIPFIILLVAIIPFTRLIVGTSIGTTAAIVPLTVAAIPFVARLTEAALREVSPGVIEAALAMGATPWQIIGKVMIRESMPSLVKAATITTISIIGYSAMAGVVGGGGLGDVAVRYGYQRFRTDIMILTVTTLMIVVAVLQFIGDRIAARLDKRS